MAEPRARSSSPHPLPCRPASTSSFIGGLCPEPNSPQQGGWGGMTGTDAGLARAAGCDLESASGLPTLSAGEPLPGACLTGSVRPCGGGAEPPGTGASACSHTEPAQRSLGSPEALTPRWGECAGLGGQRDVRAPGAAWLPVPLLYPRAPDRSPPSVSRSRSGPLWPQSAGLKSPPSVAVWFRGWVPPL